MKIINKKKLYIGLFLIWLIIPVFSSVCWVHESGGSSPHVEKLYYSNIFQYPFECSMHYCVTDSFSVSAYYIASIFSLMILILGLHYVADGLRKSGGDEK